MRPTLLQGRTLSKPGNPLLPPSVISINSGATAGTKNQQPLVHSDGTVQWTDVPLSGKAYAMPTGADDTAALTSAITDANARGGDFIEMRPGTHSVSTVSLIGVSGVKFVGAGRNVTKVKFTSTTGDVFDLSNASFCEFADMTILANAQKTAGSLFKLDNGAGVCQQNKFRRLVIASAYTAFQLTNVTLTDIDDILVQDVNATWGWNTIINASGSAISTTANRIKGGTAAGMTLGVCRISGTGVDTFHARDWDLASQSGNDMLGVFITNGEWITFTDCSIESGATLDALTVQGGDGVHFRDPHLLGQHGVAVTGGNGFELNGGETVKTNIHAIALTGGTDTSIIGHRISDVGGLGGGSGYNGVEVSAGVSDFTIVNNQIGRHVLGTTTALWGVHVNTGASDDYIIQGNRTKNFTGGGTTGVSDGGSGTNKAVANNVGLV